MTNADLPKHSYLVVVLCLFLTQPIFPDTALDQLISSKKYAEATAYADSALPSPSRTADIWAKLGEANEELGFLDRSLACYLVGSRMDPKNADALTGIAAIYNRMGMHAKALTSASKSLTLRAAAPAAREYAAASIALGKTGQAKTALQKALDLDPKNVAVIRTLADLYWKERAFDKALPLMRTACAASPNAEEAYRIGHALLDAGKTDSALVFLKDAIERNPSLFDADLDLARAYYRKEKFLASASEYEKVVDKGLMTATDYYNRAVATEKTRGADAFSAYKAAAEAFGRSKSIESVVSHLKTGSGELERKHFAAAIFHLKFVAAGDTGHSLAPDINNLLAEAYAGIGSLKRALSCLEQEAKRDETNTATLERLADLYQKARMPDKAHETYLKLAAQSPANPVLFASIGDDNLKTKRYADALDSYQKSFDLDHSARAACGVAAAAAGLEMWDRALDAARLAIQKDPSLVEPRKVAAEASLRTDRYKDAREQLDFLVSKDPAKADYWKQLAYCCKKLGDSAALAVADEKVTELDKTDIESRMRLGATLYARREYRKALEVYKSLAKLLPQNSDVFKILYNAAAALGDNLQAATYLKKYCKLLPRDAEAWKRLGDLYYDMKSFDEALVAFRKATALDPALKGVYKRYAELALSHGTREEATGALTNATGTGEADAAMCAQLGSLLEKKGAYTRAITYYGMALQMDPHGAGTTSALARCQIHAGKAADALVSLRTAVAANPDAVDEYKLIGDLYRKRNQPDSAAAAYKLFLRKSPHDTAAAMAVARQAIAGKDCATALSYLAQIDDAEAGSASYCFVRGQAFHCAKDYAAAIRSLEKARAAPGAPKDRRTTLMRLLADAYDKVNDTARAIAVYKGYLSLTGAIDPDAAYRLAKLSESTDPALAGKMYQQNAARFPDDYRNYFDAARQYARQSATYDKAIAMIRKCIAVKDTVPYLWLVLGRIYGKRGETTQELKAYQNYLLGEATNAGASEEIGTSLLDRDMAKHATIYLENANSLVPTNPDYMFQLARCYEQTNRRSEALALAEKADTLSPGNVKIGNFANYMRLRMRKTENGDTARSVDFAR
jgi:tetratricopeptide (TPR) repeat protein